MLTQNVIGDWSVYSMGGVLDKVEECLITVSKYDGAAIFDPSVDISKEIAASQPSCQKWRDMVDILRPSEALIAAQNTDGTDWSWRKLAILQMNW